MLKTLSIQGYRGFSSFEMSQLGRVNLLVGRNNCGKTSVLEALSLLVSVGDPFALLRILVRRGERLEVDTPEGASISRDVEYDISHVFYGHEVKPGGRIVIGARNSGPHRELIYTVQEASPDEFPQLFADQGSPTPRFILAVDGQPKALASALPLTPRGGLRRDAMDDVRRLRRGSSLISPPSAQFVTADSMSPDELLYRWNDLILTDGEERVASALRYLEPSVERIAATVSSRGQYAPAKAAFKVKLRDVRQPIPIGSLGDGAWRMLALAVSLIRAKDGVLLVDEIDTGLHYTVMANMWRFLDAAARDFNVQVFATTHSYDCVHSLAAICATTPNQKSHVTIQRIEQGKRKAVPFTESEILVAAQNHIEMR